MRYLKMAIAAVMLTGFAMSARADQYSHRYGDSPNIEIWTNKGYDATYYYGEDVAVYFRADADCYVVVYDIDPSGKVTVLFPSNYYNSSYVKAGEVYRIPDYYSDYTLEVTQNSGTEHIFAVATYDYINPPDFMMYVGYDYGDPGYYDDAYFVTYMRGDLDRFVDLVNGRVARGSYSVDHTRFYVDSAYRHHRHYRYWAYDPYYVGSVWIGCNFPGAEIWIDGVYFGIAPLLIPSIYYGEHWVWIYYGGYPCYQRYFYISSIQRYYIDVRIDDRYKDYRYRRTHFGGWHPLEKQYRNENGFKERARNARDEKNIRTRELPSHVLRDLEERKIISRDAPIVKRVLADARADDGARMIEKRKTREQTETRTIDRNTERDRVKVKSQEGPERPPSASNTDLRDAQPIIPRTPDSGGRLIDKGRQDKAGDDRPASTVKDSDRGETAKSGSRVRNRSNSAPSKSSKGDSLRKSTSGSKGSSKARTPVRSSKSTSSRRERER